MEEELSTESGDSVPEIRITRSMIMRRSVAIYGPSGSGKTFVTKHLLDLLRGHVDQCIIISPTEGSNFAFKHYVSPPLVHYDMSYTDPKNQHKRITGTKGVEEFLKAIWHRQEMLVNLWKVANNLKTLKRLFQKINAQHRTEATTILEKIAEEEETIKARIIKKCRGRPDEQHSKLLKLAEQFDEIKIKIYKKYIRLDIGRLWRRQDQLSDEDRQALMYFDLRPGLVIVFDDCASDICSIANKPIFKKFFYQNRHSHITAISTYQDDTDLKNNLRKNAYISLFCTDVVASAYFSRTSSGGFGKAIRTKMQEIIPTIFSKKYRILAYLRDDPKQKMFYHFTSPLPQEMPFCSSAVQELCDTMKSTEGELNRNNPYYEMFALTSSGGSRAQY